MTQNRRIIARRPRASDLGFTRDRLLSCASRL